MKQTLLLVVAFFTATLIYAQNSPIDFETGGYGADWTWAVFENDTNPALEFVANPDATGANTSATVAKFTALQAGQPWAGCESLHGADIGTFNLDASNSTVKIMVYKTEISDVGIKFVKNDGWSMGELKVPNTVMNAWEEITFDFSSQVESGYDQIVVFPDFQTRAQDNIVYFDNITFSPGGGSSTDPTVAAPTPTPAQADVISLFSDAYTDVTVDTWNTTWSVAVYEEVLVDGNPTKKYSALDYNGIETVSSPIDATTPAMMYFHMDIWTPNSTQFRVVLVDWLGDGYAGGNGDTEGTVFIETPALEEWVSLDIPLADFTAAGMTAQTDLNQIIIGSLPAGTSTVYVDNVYFSKVPSTAGINDFEIADINVYPNPTINTWNINSDQTIERIDLYDISGKMVKTLAPNSSDYVIDASNLNFGIYIAKVETSKGVNQVKLIKK